jgi:hypothetical protein
MKKFVLNSSVLFILLLIPLSGSASGKEPISAGNVQITQERVDSAIAPDKADVSRLSGEQVQRQVISSGASTMSGANYVVSGTVTQTAIGDAASSGFNFNQGFWQRAASPADHCTPYGDADGSGAVDIDDVVFLIGYIFSGGPAPDPICCGDADGSGAIDIDDVVYLIGYIFSGGPAPVPVDC